MGQSNGNGNGTNGSGHHRAAPRFEGPEESTSEVALGLESVPAPDMDPVHTWKGATREQLTLSLIHEGLISVSSIAETALESNVRLNRNLEHHWFPTLTRTEALAQTIASKLEVNSRLVDKVDDDLVTALAENKTAVNVMRRDIQFIKDDVSEIRKLADKIPVMLEILGEIMARLPER